MCVIDVPFFTGQAIQRQLEEVAEKQRDLEERGVAIEKTIRGETERGTEPYSHTNACVVRVPTEILEPAQDNIELLLMADLSTITPWFNVRPQCGSKKFHCLQLMAILTINCQTSLLLHLFTVQVFVCVLVSSEALSG